MSTVNLADARAQLSALVTQAASGDPVCITRRGKPVAQLTAIDRPRKRIALSMLRSVTEGMPKQPQSAREFIRAMRNENRY